MRVIEEDAARPFEALTRVEKSEIRYHIVIIGEALSVLAQHIARSAGARPQTPIQAVRELVNMRLATAEKRLRNS